MKARQKSARVHNGRNRFLKLARIIRFSVHHARKRIGLRRQFDVSQDSEIATRLRVLAVHSRPEPSKKAHLAGKAGIASRIRRNVSRIARSKFQDAILMNR